jgi:hypothetical protein
MEESIKLINNLFIASINWIADHANPGTDNSRKIIEELDSKIKLIEGLRNVCAENLLSLRKLDQVKADEELEKIRIRLDEHPNDTHMTGIQNMRAILNTASDESSLITLFKLQKCTLERTNLSWPLNIWSESDLLNRGRGRKQWAKDLYARVNNIKWLDFININEKSEEIDLRKSY